MHPKEQEMSKGHQVRIGRSYVCGAYGGKTVPSFTETLDWKNEWDEIPSEQKKELVKWLDEGDIVHRKLCEMSLIASHENPVAKHLVKEKRIPEPDIEGHIEKGEQAEEVLFCTASERTKAFFRDKVPGILSTYYGEAKPFIEAFFDYKERGFEMIKILDGRKLQIGFGIESIAEHHMIKLASLTPIWKLPEEKTLEQNQQNKMKEASHKSDEYLGKIFKTTRDHPWGECWAGILELNTSKLSTIIGGSQHAISIPVPHDRYRIRWMNVKTRAQKETICESSDISKMIDTKQIVETDGHEKAPAVYPRNSYPEYGTFPRSRTITQDKTMTEVKPGRST